MVREIPPKRKTSFRDQTPHRILLSGSTCMIASDKASGASLRGQPTVRTSKFVGRWIHPDHVYLVRNGILNFGPTAISAFCALVLIPLYVRRLGAEAYGLWIFVNVFSAFVGDLDFGLNVAVTREVARPDGEDAAAKSRFVKAAGIAYIGIGIVGGLMTAALGLVASRFLGLSAPLVSVAPSVCVIAGVGFVFSQMISYSRAVLLGLGSFGTANALSAGLIVTIAAGSIAVLLSGLDVIAVASASTAAYVVVAFLSYCAVVVHRGDFSVAFRLGLLRELRRTWHTSVVDQGSMMAIKLVWEAGPFLIGALLGAPAIVAYHIGMRIPAVAAQFSWKSAEVLLPLVTSGVARRDSRVWKSLIATTRWIQLLLLPFVVVLWVIAPFLLRWWLGEPPPGSVAVLRLAAGVIVVDGFGVGALYVGWGIGQSTRILRILFAAALLTIVGGISLIPLIGVAGMVCGMLAAATFSSLGLIRLVAGECEAGRLEFFAKTLKDLLIPVGACGAVAAGIRMLLHRSPAALVVATSVAAGVVFVVSIIGGRRFDRPIIAE